MTAQPLPWQPPHLGPVVDEPNRRARFAPHELAIVLSHFDIGPIRQMQVCPLGSRQSPKMRLLTRDGQFLLKRRAPGRDDTERVAFAHSLLKRLHRASFPVPGLVPTREQSMSGLALDGRVYELFEFIEGERCGRGATATARAGATLGRLHGLMAGYDGRHRPPVGSFHAAAEVDGRLDRIADAVAGAEPGVDRGAVEAAVEGLRSAYRRAAEAVEDLGFAGWKPLILHGDWHPGNLIVRDEAVVGVLDFDSARLEPRIVDVANGCLQFSMLMGRADDPRRWPEGLDPARMRSFLEGYDSLARAPLAPAERAAVPWLVVEALVVESIVPIAATGTFGRVRGSDFLAMVQQKIAWLGARTDRLIEYLRERDGT